MRTRGVGRMGLTIGVAVMLSSMAGGLSGCVGLALGGAASAGVAASEDRGLGGALDDTRIRADINEKWMNASMDMLQKVDLSVNEGRVLLTGTVPTSEMRLQAVKLVWQVDGVRQVMDEIKVGKESGVGDYSRDVWISTQLRSDILFDRSIQSVNYSVETVDGTVYLMGVAQSQDELARVTNYARNLNYVKRVVSFVRVKDQAAPASRPATQATGTPAPAPGGTASTPEPAPAAAPDRAPVDTAPLPAPDKPS
ncbi:MAG TPA: BON domain-containing protein [Candidatus Sulfotelmatobacter sp.]|nr:BON domain-containing protein [Candidatus Sulfotelmatobacter sp.]